MEVKSIVPVIDMQHPGGLAEKIVKASEEWGCFRITNHGISLELLSEMKVVCRSLLDLPLKIKQGNASPYFQGLNIDDVSFPGVADDFFSQVNASTLQR
ncbi:OLC1v1023399C1 [Oldenlandia corymbosa var. corymbosa]|uniref:OLC1v1023399C1 n=1 Tax=Oldenlandia corymbosa var. corymbosa TaxID=529605 RepID=A0AAV1BZV6_OLDCO|nr:OLC1v1023399C1 [Oldenlandia corymbosa var. corymbosa]